MKNKLTKSFSSIYLFAILTVFRFILYSIPSGTSPELRHLLLGMLKRNARDRIPFEEFFKHKFLRPRASKSCKMAFLVCMLIRHTYCTVYVRLQKNWYFNEDYFQYCLASPVPVPRTRSRSTGSESPASVKAVSASPLSANIATSPPVSLSYEPH